MICLAPRAREKIVRPRRLSGVVMRPLNFTVRGQPVVPILTYGARPIRRLYFRR